MGAYELGISQSWQEWAENEWQWFKNKQKGVAADEGVGVGGSG